MARSTVSGIYSITNKADGKVYVGQSQNIAKRIRYHKDYDRDCTHLYHAINLYGWDAFEVTVLEEVSDNKLLNEREQYWMDALESYNPKKGYNILRWANGKATSTKFTLNKIVIRSTAVKDCYRLGEVAKMLNVSYATMWHWCNDGRVASVKLPSGQRRIVLSEVKRIINSKEGDDGEIGQARQAAKAQASGSQRKTGSTYMNEKLLTMTEAAKRMKIGYVTLYRAVESGKVLAIKTPGGRRRIPESEVDRYWQEQDYIPNGVESDGETKQAGPATQTE